MSDGQWIERATLDLWEDRHREQLAFIKELATKLATCEKYRDAYAEMDRIGTQAVRDLEAKLAECEARLGKAVEALTTLAAIADAFDANELDDEARKFWGQHSVNTTPHEDIELYQGRAGRQLLTLANCMFARATLAELKGESHE